MQDGDLALHFVTNQIRYPRFSSADDLHLGMKYQLSKGTLFSETR